MLKSKLTANTSKGNFIKKRIGGVSIHHCTGTHHRNTHHVKQMNYFMDQPLGFDKDAIVNVPFRPDSTGGKLTDYLKQQLLSNGVQAVSFNSNSPIEDDK
jgi:hypothetical protein